MVRFKVSLVQYRPYNILKVFSKNRWFLVEFIPIPIVGPTTENNNNLGFESDGKQIYSAIKQSVLENYGDVGWGAVGLSLTGALITEKTQGIRPMYANLQ